jgi:hypothetical protein
MSVVALAKKDDPRASLRSAITDAQKARTAVDRQHAAIERGRLLVREAQARVTAAGIAVGEARQERAQRAVDALATGGAPTSTSLVRIAQDHERDAGDDLSAAKEALVRLESDLVLMTANEAVARKTVECELATVLEPTLRALIEAARAHRAKFLATQAAANELARLWNPWDEISKETDRLSSFNIEANARVSDASAAKWRAAIEALRTDPDASLPDLESERSRCQ